MAAVVLWCSRGEWGKVAQGVLNLLANAGPRHLTRGGQVLVWALSLL